MFGIPCAFSLWLQQDGADVDWQAAIFPLDGDTALAGTATIAGETFGRITRISLGVPGVDFEGSTFGHVFILNDDVQSIWHTIRNRSEEHTSELQSLMRISYDVFCLKKNTTNQPTDIKART